GATLMGGNKDSRSWVGFDDPNIHRLPFPYPWTGEGLSGADRARRDLAGLAQKGIDPDSDLCAVLLESYQGWAAVFYPEDYVQEIAAFAKRHGLLLAFDEIQSGFGRTGRLFAYQHYGVEPDLVLCGKGMSSSLPLSAVLGRAHLLDLPETGSMSSTHSANPLACAAGLANLESLSEENLVAEAARKGELLSAGLRALQLRHPNRIAHVLGRGLIAAVLLTEPESGAPDAAMATRAAEIAMRKGLLLVHTGRESIKIGPPLTIPDDALAEGIDVLGESLEEAIAR
ncbi:MAG: aminotransferase class III-fold pyridoxal phosphate-dependent enzyme, partial [Rhodospirillales bacterium]